MPSIEVSFYVVFIFEGQCQDVTVTPHVPGRYNSTDHVGLLVSLSGVGVISINSTVYELIQ